MSMSRRDAFRRMSAIGMTAGVSAVAVDAAGAITPPEEAKGRFVVVLRPDRPLPAGASERLRDLFRDVINHAEIDATVAVLPHGLELSTVKPDGSIESTNGPSPAAPERPFPWMGDAMFHFTTRGDLYKRRVSIKATTEPEGDVGSRVVKVTLVSLINPSGDSWQVPNPSWGREFETTHTIRIDESQNTFNNWDSVEAFGEHNRAADEEMRRLYLDRVKELQSRIDSLRKGEA